MRWFVHLHGRKPQEDRREQGVDVDTRKYANMLEAGGFDVWITREAPQMLKRDGSLREMLLGGGRLLSRRHVEEAEE